MDRWFTNCTPCTHRLSLVQPVATTTDWIEDIMLQVMYHRSGRPMGSLDSLDRPTVSKALEVFGKIVRNSDYVYGAPAAVPSTNLAIP